jgi:membrane protein insertase Oxa1/YidC/SpoIIIJ
MLLAQSTTTREGILQISQVTQLIVPLIGAGITVFFAWQFASGVALYRLVVLILNMVQQFFITGRQALQATPGIAAAGSGDSIMVRGSEQREALQAPAKTRRQHRRSAVRRRGKNPKKRHQ